MLIRRTFLQAIFFTPANLSTPDALLWLGVMICGMTLLITLIYFPMWCVSRPRSM